MKTNNLISSSAAVFADDHGSADGHGHDRHERNDDDDVPAAHHGAALHDGAASLDDAEQRHLGHG